MMNPDEIAMGEAAREMLDRPETEPVGTLSPSEMALAPLTREWIETEEAWAYFALSMAAGIRQRLARMGDDERSREIRRLSTAREIAAKHLDALREAGALYDELLIEMAKAEGIEP